MCAFPPVNSEEPDGLFVAAMTTAMSSFSGHKDTKRIQNFVQAALTLPQALERCIWPEQLWVFAKNYAGPAGKYLDETTKSMNTATHPFRLPFLYSPKTFVPEEGREVLLH